MADYRQTYADEQKKLLMSQALAKQAMTPNQRPQGRIVASTGAADGLMTLATALASRRAGKQATALGKQGDEERRKAQAAALSGMGRPPNAVETPEAQDPYMRAQGALEADVDPNVVGAYLKSKQPGKEASPFGVVDPSDFTPESMAKFAQTHSYGDLVPVDKMTGRYTPSNYTPESWAEFRATNDPKVLVLRPSYDVQATPGGGILATNKNDPTKTTPVLSPETGTAQAAARKEAEAAAAARGQASGSAEGAILSRALNADSINDILDIADPLIDEATGSGSGAIRDQLGAFFGVSTEGAQATAQLQPLQAALMLRQPRMEGPQSDADVILYKQAAGQIGDPKVPGPTKKAAMKTIRRLNDKYKGDSASKTSAAPTFATEQDAAAAAAAGKLKPGARVTIGGVPGTWQ